MNAEPKANVKQNASAVDLPGPAPDPSQAPGLAPWWRERHRESVRREFENSMEQLEEHDRRAIIDLVSFLLFAQECKKGAEAGWSFFRREARESVLGRSLLAILLSVARGSLLHTEFKIQQAWRS